MPASQRLGSAAVHLSAGAGPLSLLLLPKCPLCLIPLLAFFGIALPASTSLWIVAGILVAAWFAVLLIASRRQPLIRAAACIAAAVSIIAVGIHSRPLLWGAIFVMSVAGFAVSRICTLRCHSTVAQL
jgi:hypothetical protein